MAEPDEIARQVDGIYKVRTDCHDLMTVMELVIIIFFFN